MGKLLDELAELHDKVEMEVVRDGINIEQLRGRVRRSRAAWRSGEKRSDDQEVTRDGGLVTQNSSEKRSG